ncbi:sugar phosphate isomerase/epimerase [Sulfitobacter sp. D35]|uniref:sugar phosphate isomerase/epimerase family protein n=1 Tax=Sulfitobacter sp. D35 TaxID=3083252 RepID=UPI00296EA724|nr:sugar phosphate isomerase/epimerase [Sulfitobacter sp. D35]MDW4498931.1 sugar phosphate isomerase/epimerase [Sulfitobacter sp. D35]
MQIGMNMFLWTTNVGRDHEELLADIRATGFDGVEIPVFEGGPDDYAGLARMLDGLDLDRTAVSALGDPAFDLVSADAQVRAAAVARMKEVVDCTAALGAQVVAGPLHSVLGQFSGSGPTEDELERAANSLRQVGEHAAAAEVIVALEALNRFECYLVNTMDDLAALLRRIEHPNLRAMYDTFHANIEETDPQGALRRNADDVVHIHISENDRGVPGRGNIPWDETFATIRDIGYDGWLTIESFGRGLPDLAAATKVWRDFAESPEAVYREGYAHIAGHLGRH